MKKFCLVISALVLATGAFAQDKTYAQLKNEGQQYFKEKKYQQALESYQAAIAALTDSTDIAIVFNAGYSANKSKNYELAYTYFTQCEEAGYKKGESAYYKAGTLKAQGKTEEYEAALEAGYNTYKDGSIARAFKKDYARVIRDKAYKLYNEGSEVQKTMQTAKADKMDALKAEALEKFNEAKPLIEQSLEVNPDDQNAQKIKEGIDKQIAALQ